MKGLVTDFGSDYALMVIRDTSRPLRACLQWLSAGRRCGGEWPSSADADVEDHTEADRVEACVSDPLVWCRSRPPRLMRDCGEGGVECGGDERDRAEDDQAPAGGIVARVRSPLEQHSPQ